MNKNCLLFGVVAFCLTSISCSSTPKQWYKAGATAEVYERDKTDCEDSLLETGTTGSASQVYTFETCMENKGWVVLDKPAL